VTIVAKACNQIDPDKPCKSKFDPAHRVVKEPFDDKENGDRDVGKNCQAH